MITVENDWVEYATVPARRVAVRGGAACTQRLPVSVDRGALRPTVGARPATGRDDQAAPTGERPRRAGRLRLTARGRAVFVLVPAVVALSAALVGTAAPFAQADPAAAAHRSVTVRAGDTLWSIAGRIAPDRDPRDVVAELEGANRLSGAAVLAGSRLVVPADLGR